MFKRKGIWVVAIALVGAVVFLHGYNSNNIKFSPSYQTSSMQNIEIAHKEDNIVKWKLSSDVATFPTNTKTVYLDRVDITINHTPEITISGKSGVYEIEDEIVTLSTDVELSIKETVFSTDRLHLLNKEDIVKTESPITYSGKSFLVKGTGLLAKMEEQEVKILNDVKATFYH